MAALLAFVTLGRTTTYARPTYAKIQPQIVKKVVNLPKLDEFGNVIKKLLSPCERGDSRFEVKNGVCVAKPPTVVKTVLTPSSVKANQTTYEDLLFPAPCSTVVHVWSDGYAGVVYVNGEDDTDAHRNAECVALILHAQLKLSYGATGEGSVYTGKHGWNGSGSHVTLPGAWYKALEQLGVKGMKELL